MPTVQKICCACGTDVANAKRVKDQRGHYYCELCYESKRQQHAAAHHTAAAPISVAAAASSHGAPADDGMIGLADEIAPPVQEEMFGCSDCKRVVPKRQIRNQDGEFICGPCFSKRRNPVATASSRAAPARKSFAEEDGEPEGGVTFRYTLLGGVCISAFIVVVSWFLFLGLDMAMPIAAGRHVLAPPTGFLFSAIFATVEAVFIVFRAASLIVSMVIAAKIVGGIDFGYLGNTLWKAVAAALVFSLVAFFMDRNETFMMLGFGVRGIIFLVTFAALFKLDFFESMVLSVVNFFIFWGLAIAMAIVVVMIGHAMSHRTTIDEDDEDAPIVQPQHVPAPAPAPMPAPAPAPAQ